MAQRAPARKPKLSLPTKHHFRQSVVSIRLTHGQKSASEHHAITAPGLIGQDDRVTLETRSAPIGQANAALVRFGGLPIEPSCTGFEVGEATL
jgi:hypothetical protein